MTWKKFFTSLAATIPSLVVVFVSSWFDVFRNSLILRPSAGALLEQTAVAVSSVCVVVFALIFRHSSPSFHKTTTLVLMIISAVLFSMAYWLRMKLGYELPRDSQEAFIRLWDFSAWFFIVMIIQTILFAFMYAIRRIEGSSFEL